MARRYCTRPVYLGSTCARFTVPLQGTVAHSRGRRVLSRSWGRPDALILPPLITSVTLGTALFLRMRDSAKPTEMPLFQ